MTPEEQAVHDGGTEAPFSGKYWDHHKDGSYHCKSCGALLFESRVKLDSSKGPLGLQGWPAFSDAVSESLSFHDDDSLGMHRVEVKCASCGIHLGHIFDDPETDTNKHYCINSCSLDFRDE